MSCSRYSARSWSSAKSDDLEHHGERVGLRLRVDRDEAVGQDRHRAGVACANRPRARASRRRARSASSLERVVASRSCARRSASRAAAPAACGLELLDARGLSVDPLARSATPPTVRSRSARRGSGVAADATPMPAPATAAITAPIAAARLEVCSQVVAPCSGPRGAAAGSSAHRDRWTRADWPRWIRKTLAVAHSLAAASVGAPALSPASASDPAAALRLLRRPLPPRRWARRTPRRSEGSRASPRPPASVTRRRGRATRRVAPARHPSMSRSSTPGSHWASVGNQANAEAGGDQPLQDLVIVALEGDPRLEARCAARGDHVLAARARLLPAEPVLVRRDPRGRLAPTRRAGVRAAARRASGPCRSSRRRCHDRNQRAGRRSRTRARRRSSPRLIAGSASSGSPSANWSSIPGWRWRTPTSPGSSESRSRSGS